jgi:thiol-disulfide isomerase/thioredoxin
MATITTVLYDNYIKPRKRTWLAIIMIIIFGILGYYAFKWYAKPVIKNKASQNVANVNTRDQTVELYFFYADWCPHCTKAKPQWAAFKQSYDGKPVNGYTIQCIEVNCTEESPTNNRLIQKYSVNSYPTLIMVKDGNRIDFDSKITTDSLTQFVNTVLQ